MWPTYHIIAPLPPCAPQLPQSYTARHPSLANAADPALLRRSLCAETYKQLHQHYNMPPTFSRGGRQPSTMLNEDLLQASLDSEFLNAYRTRTVSAE